MAIYDVPVAHSMLAAIRHLGTFADPMQQFMCYWIAFNNIYVTIAESQGLRPEHLRREDGTEDTRCVGGVRVPKVKGVSERLMMDRALRLLTDEARHRLLQHRSTKYFVERVPQWRGQRITHDQKGQRLNGVLNVGHTLSANEPIWSPINPSRFQRFLSGRTDRRTVGILTREVLGVIYTVRNNLFHGGKRNDDANDRQVLENALPLLQLIVESLIPDRMAA